MSGARKLGNLVVVAAMVALPLGLSAQKATYVRPTTLIVPGQMSTEMLGALNTYCADKCAGTRWANRSFSEGVHPLVQGLKATGTKADSALATSAGAVTAARNLVKAQFLVSQDFTWSWDSLMSRRAYSLSADEARKLAAAQKQMDENYAKPLTNSFLFVVSDSGAPTVKEEGGKTKAEQKVQVAVFKLAYDGERIVKDLGAISCFPGDCNGRDQRRSQFDAYAPPLALVASFSVSASSEVSEGGKDAAINALAGEVVNTMIDETASAVPSFALTARVARTGPFAARVGMKEGVYRGHRFYAYNGEERTAVLYAKDVADNRVATFGGTATKVVVNAADSTTFKKVYPGEVAEGTLIRETPSYFSIAARGMTFDGELSLGIELRDEGFLASRSPVPVPFGVKTLGAFQYVPIAGGESYRYIGAGAGYELYPLMGKFRIMPLGIIYYSSYDDGQEGTSQYEKDSKGVALALGADIGLRVTPEIEVSLTTRMLGRATNVGTSASPVVEMQYGSTFGFGVRLQRGLWGAF